jgi:hypothetical protein
MHVLYSTCTYYIYRKVLINLLFFYNLAPILNLRDNLGSKEKNTI